MIQLINMNTDNARALLVPAGILVMFMLIKAISMSRGSCCLSSYMPDRDAWPVVESLLLF